MNYDSTNIGVPYTRVNDISIKYPPTGLPEIKISQAIAVKLADLTTVEVSPAPPLTFTLDMINDALIPIPLVDPTSGAPLGPNTNLQTVMLNILAVVRKKQKEFNP